MDTFDIDLPEITEPAKENSILLPTNYITVGQVNTDDVRVYIHQTVYKELLEYAASDTGRELGSILVGTWLEDVGCIYVIVTHHILAKYTESSAATLTFTHETWNDIYHELDQCYPNEKIVGWQHTHPGYGLFLSGYDMFIQENFFNAPFQLAYVIDPIQQSDGFFQWKNGSVQRVFGYYVFDDPGTKISVGFPKAKHRAKPKKKSPAAKAMIILAFVLLAVSLAIGIYWIIQHTKDQIPPPDHETVTPAVYQSYNPSPARFEIEG